MCTQGTAFCFLHSYLMGLYAFGLEETNLYPIAEKTAWKVQ